MILFISSCNDDDVNNKAWTQKTSLPAKARMGAIGFAINGKGYVGLGVIEYPEFCNDFWEYNPATDQWTEKAKFPGDLRMGAFAFVVEGKAYVGGGTGTHGAMNDLYEYDPTTDEWNMVAGMNEPRYDAISFTIEGKGYVGLGALYDRQNNFIQLNDLWNYAPDRYEWTRFFDFQGAARLGASAFTIGRKAYITTGCTDDTAMSSYFNDTWEYDSDNNLWSKKKDFPVNNCRNANGFNIGNYGYVAMANGNELWQYQPDMDQWIKKEGFPNGFRFKAACFVLNNKAYIVTGAGSNNTLCNDLWAYDPSEDQ